MQSLVAQQDEEEQSRRVQELKEGCIQEAPAGKTESNSGFKNRSRLEIFAVILDAARTAQQKTHLMYRARLCHKVTLQYVNELERAALLEDCSSEGDGLKRLYRTTPRGFKYLEICELMLERIGPLENNLKRESTNARREQEVSCTPGRNRSPFKCAQERRERNQLELSSGITNEIILAEEQDVLKRSAGTTERIEATLGLGDEVEGTLVLTNKRLVFSCASDQENVIESRGLTKIVGRQNYYLIFSDVEDLNRIPKGPPNLFIPLESIDEVKGHRGEITLPSLEIRWRDESREEKVVLHQRIVEQGRKKNLNDWANVIERLRKGEQRVTPLPPAPNPESTLEGKVYHVLGDMQEKGALQIESEVESLFEIDSDPDAIEEACQKLVSAGLVDVVKDPSEDFFRRRSPLGMDDLSS